MSGYDDYPPRSSRKSKSSRYPDNNSDDDQRSDDQQSARPRRSKYEESRPSYKESKSTADRIPKSRGPDPRDYGDPRDIEPKGSDSDRKNKSRRSAGRRDDPGDDEDEDGFVKVPRSKKDKDIGGGDLRFRPSRKNTYADDDDDKYGPVRSSKDRDAAARGSKRPDSYDDDPLPRKTETKRRDRDAYDEPEPPVLRRSGTSKSTRDAYDEPRSSRKRYDDYNDDALPSRSRRDDRDDNKGYKSDRGGGGASSRRGHADYDNPPPRAKDRYDSDRDRDHGYGSSNRDRPRRDDYDSYDRKKDRSDRDRGYRSLDDAPRRSYSTREPRRDRDRDRYDSDRDRDRDRYGNSSRRDKSRSGGNGKSSSSGLIPKNIDMDTMQKHYQTFKPIITSMAKMYMDSRGK